MTDAPFEGPVLIIAPHPDDEVLGAGGTMARLADANVDVYVLVVTRGRPPQFSQEQIERVRKEALAAHALLGVKNTIFLDHPAANLDQTAHAELNRSIGAVVRDLRPATMLLPFVGDIHLDHQLVFQSALVAARPHGPIYPRRLLCYETLSETNWNAPHVTPGFTPNLFVDVSATLERKLNAMSAFSSQTYEPPHERSLNALKALATLRGATVHLPAAESFMQLRQVI